MPLPRCAPIRNAAYFCAGVALLDANGRLIGLRPVTVPRRGRGYLSPADVRRVIRRSDFWVLGTATVYRRNMLAEIGYFDARLGSLGDVLANRLLAFKHGFYFDPDVLASYNKDPMSFSARNALSVSECRQMLDARRGLDRGKPARRRPRASIRDCSTVACGLAWRACGSSGVKLGLMPTQWPTFSNFGVFDRAVLRALAHFPLGSSFLALGWMTIRVPPFSLPTLAQAWWRAQSFRWFGRAAVQAKADAANAAFAAYRAGSADQTD